MKQYTAKNLDDLLKQVANEKNVNPDELVYYVIEEKSGFLGIGASVTAEVYALSDVSDFVKAYLQTFFDGMGQAVEISVEQSKSNIRIAINAENNAILIGRGGKSLEGLNLLVKNAVNAQFKRRFFVSLDINNYKNERYQKLKAMAKRIAKQVQRTKVDATLDPMPNDERRTIHKELTEFPNIRTVSEGSGRNRHLKIVYDPNKE
ncbi:KH domain-containing protein [Erysipelothrix sp. HDW6C]|uniref:Jag family protein n=1 Tax=Erysipelothrix sp. HDW6C TaxID=2714930 RepID=UPI00140D1CB4|nr:R3H domain-containing nucleic acid-binding protein [Erysipelothrix sp. HDW6C]QIK69077.1 KH domain-containing protein [Erysipelothrix sp. HDW6C]